MARFSIAGRKGNLAGRLSSEAVRQAGDTGYDEAGRKRLDAVSEAVDKLLEDLPADANLSIAGSISQTRGVVDIQLEIHGNHPDLGQDTGYVEPLSIAEADGSRNQHPNADKRDEAKVEASKQGQPSADPFATATPAFQTSRDPVTQPTSPAGHNG